MPAAQIIVGNNLACGNTLTKALVDGCQGCRAAEGIHAQPACRSSPGGHNCRERYQQEHAAEYGGVEDILAKASEAHLGNTDGGYRAQERHPPGGSGRQVKRQQHTRKTGGRDGGDILAQQIILYDEFAGDAGCHAHHKQHKEVPAVEQQGHQHRRGKRDKHIVHQNPCGHGALEVRRK